MSLWASPDWPDSPSEEAIAPEPASARAVPRAVAALVAPDVPVVPVVASPPTARAVPKAGALLVADGLALASPDAPVAPELPERAFGLAPAAAVAAPVSPELVADELV